MWEYKWEKDAGDVYGPFTWSEMNQWFEQGFFQQYTATMVVRHVTPTTPLDSIKGFVFHDKFPN